MAKVRISHDFSKVLEAIESDYLNLVGESLKDRIIDLISKGISPVKGQNRFKRYSQSYIDQMQGKVSFRVSKKNKLLKAIKPGLPADKVKFAGKRARPVNLKLTGALHRSIKKRVTKSGLTIWFSDEKAEWHNEGTDKMPARRLLPLEGEELSRVIEKELEKSLTDIVQTAFK